MNSWFALVESAFESADIRNDHERHTLTVAALPEYVLSELCNKLTTLSYEILKEVVIGNYSKSKGECCSQLLRREEMGDDKPSQFFRRCRNLVSNVPEMTDNVLKILFMEKLPAFIRQSTFMSEFLPLREYLDHCDRATEAMKSYKIAVIEQPMKV